MSDHYTYLKMVRYAQLVQAPPGDPSAAATFDRHTLRKHDHGKKRVGRPRLNWVEVTQEQFWDLLVKPSLPPGDRRGLNLDIQLHIDRLKEATGVVVQNRDLIKAALGY